MLLCSRLLARKFQLSSLSNNNNQLDLDCDGLGRDNHKGDYLLIPDGQSKQGRRGTKWCGTSAQHSVVACKYILLGRLLQIVQSIIRQRSRRQILALRLLVFTIKKPKQSLVPFVGISLENGILFCVPGLAYTAISRKSDGLLLTLN